jgi:hypothetical protein
MKKTQQASDGKSAKGGGDSHGEGYLSYAKRG